MKAKIENIDIKNNLKNKSRKNNRSESFGNWRFDA